MASDGNQSGADSGLCYVALQDLVSSDSQVGKYKLGKYRIKKGDTLSDLSRKCGLPVEELAQLNDLDDPNLIQAGAKILLAFPRHFLEELAQSVLSRPRERATEAAHGRLPTVRVSERRERRAAVREAPVLDELQRESMSAATASQPVQSATASQPLRGDAARSGATAKVVGGSQTFAYTVGVSSLRVPRMGYRLPSQWASLGALLLMVAASSLALRVGANTLWGAYVSVWSHLAERKVAERDRRAALDAAKKAEAQRMKKWWRSVVDDDRKAAQLAPDANNGSVRSRLPSEPSIGKQAREIEQKRLEEEYNMFIRKIKVKDKDDIDGLIG